MDLLTAGKRWPKHTVNLKTESKKLFNLNQREKRLKNKD